MPEKLTAEVPIVNLIQENLDSQCLSLDIETILLTFLENHSGCEIWEDKLKEYISLEVSRATGYYKVVLQRILDIICKIDEIQDRQIEIVLQKSRFIRFINKQSNGILMNYDPIRAERYRRKIDRQLHLDLGFQFGIQTFKRERRIAM